MSDYQDVADALISNIIRDVAELPDRTSPDDQPDVMLVSSGELRLILTERVADLSAATARIAELEAEREAFRKERDALRAENARLRQVIADEANRINIEGSAYHKAQLALDEIAVGLKTRARAALAATSGGK